MTASNGIEIERRGVVTVIRMDRGENRFHPDLLDGLRAVLDQVEAAEGDAALVLTGTGKFFSNGLDLDYMSQNPDDAEPTLARVHALLGRVLGFEVPTVAAINGHAFAAGAMLALAADEAVMREDRGYFCLPEADLGIPFTAAMNALITARLSAPVAHRGMVTGHRFTAAEALAGGIVGETAPEPEVLECAVARAEALAGKPRASLAQIKRGMYAEALDLLAG